jgi:hypothetical protein
VLVEDPACVLFDGSKMSAEIYSPRPPGATLVAAATLDGLVRRHADETPRPALIALGLLATGAAVAVAHITGTEVRAAFGSGHSDFLPSLLSRALARQAAPVGP